MAGWAISTAGRRAPMTDAAANAAHHRGAGAVATNGTEATGR
jgi:predicted ThiF/HesA family dinucleotide-utilizing enzyme